MAHHIASSLFIVTVLIGFASSIFITVSPKDTCSTQNYSPCTCDDSNGQSDRTVTCNRVALSEVRAAFDRTSTSTVSQLVLTPSTSDSIIPANLLGTKKVTTLKLYCPSRLNALQLNADAFRASQSVLQTLNVENCELSSLNWTFLSGFNNLSSLTINYASNLHATFYTLPLLPALSSLTLYSITNLNQWTTFPPLSSNGLTQANIIYNYDLGDAAIGRILYWMLYTSASTMTSLSIAANTLTIVPRQIASFTELTSFSFYNNLAPLTISAGSLALPKLSEIYLDNSRITSIEPGAFGDDDFSKVYVDLYRNSLTRFESGVFLSMLQQMYQSSGRLEVYANAFDCTTDPCHLAWLIRDNPQLLSPVWSAQCSDGTYFHQLNPSSYSSCP